MEVKFKKLYSDSICPKKGSKYDAGFDIYAHGLPEEGIDIRSGETVMIGSGVAMAIPEGWFGAIYARSGLACKQNIRPSNCVGIVDASYRLEVMVSLHRDFKAKWEDECVYLADGEICHINDFFVDREPYHINNGDRIAQMIFHQVPEFEFIEVDELDETDRGEGFGSSGK